MKTTIPSAHQVTPRARRRFALGGIVIAVVTLAALITLAFALGMHRV